MKVTDHERRELIRLLSIRVEGYPARQATAEEAGMLDVDVRGEPDEAWARLIEQAIARRKLPALLLAAERQFPGDKALKALSEGAKEGRIVVEIPDEGGGGPPVWGVLRLVGLLALIGVAVWWFFPDLFRPAEEEEPFEGPIPEVEVRHGLKEGEEPAPEHRAAPSPAPAPAEPAPAEPVPEPSGRYIKVAVPEPAPEEPAPETP